MRIKKQQGISLYLALVILSSLTTALLAAVVILVSQTKIIYALGDSVAAFYAADTGAEELLYGVYKTGFDPQSALKCPTNSYSGDWGDIEYSVCVDPDDNTKIYSTGTYTKTNTTRRIELEITF